MYKADAGGLNFRLKRTPSRDNHVTKPKIYLIAKCCPHDLLYEITFDYETNNIHIKTGERVFTSSPLPAEFFGYNEIDIWMTWLHKEISIGSRNKTLYIYPRNITREKLANDIVGYIKFESTHDVSWKIQESPRIYNITPEKDISGGNLHWVTIEDNKLPPNAMIGGFETNLIYIARAMYSGSLCPGKYVHEERKAYVAWGGEEHEKSNFQILCGYNSKWVPCTDDNIPENAYVAGLSEVRMEPLYIGRAFIGNKLVVGKVHTLYKSCYLPYRGEEIERTSYEILVDLSIKPKGQTWVCCGKCQANISKMKLVLN